MKTKIRLQSWTRLAGSMAVLFLALAVSAKADCGVATNQVSIFPRFAVANMPAARAATPEARPGTEGGDDAPIVGLWNTTFVSGGQIVDQGFDLWTSDGTEILNDDPPPATGNVCLGVYVKSGKATYKLTHPSWTFDSAGNVNGTAIIREQVTIAKGGNSFSGSYTITFYDLSGNSAGSFAGTLTAQRITVDF